MYRLKAQFKGQVDFFDLDVDKAETAAVRERFGLLRRSQYALIDREGNVVLSWAGPLRQEAVAADIATYLESNEP